MDNLNDKADNTAGLPEKSADQPSVEAPKPAQAPLPALPTTQTQKVSMPAAQETASAETPVTEEPMDRRSFIKWLTVGWGAFAAVLAGYGAMFMRFMFPNVLFEPKQTFKAGFPDEYPLGQVSERWKTKYGTWIVREGNTIYALSTTCTHLGCTPNWLGDENKFKCPCHGSGFYKTGINFEGPAPRPLERYRIALADDGQILVDKTKKYQQEKGEWNDPESFLQV